MEKQEALDRLKLIETMVSENRGAAVDNGRAMMIVGLLLPAYIGLASLLDIKNNPVARSIAIGVALLCLLYVAYEERQRYLRFKRKPTLAYRVYNALALGMIAFMVPLQIMEQRGLLAEEAALSLAYALIALSFAVYRPILGYAWLNAAAALWFIGACLGVSGAGISPLLLASVLSVLGFALPGWLLYRQRASD